MQSVGHMQLNQNLELMWGPNREYLRRMLIGISRDIDLADDLLQETYINALGGISGYRGGDARAWLAAIARNTFFAHARRRYVKNEVTLDMDIEPQTAPHADTACDLTLLELRKALSDLKPTLRTALIMKHYGGFSYSEIGERVGCPEGTARRRVWTAIRQLRSVLLQADGEKQAMKCAQVRGLPLLDYVYGVLPPEKAGQIRKHLVECAFCRAEADEIRKITTALDSVEGDYKLTRIIDIDAQGVPMEYSWWSMANGFNHTMETNWWTVNKDHCFDFAMLQGQEVTLTMMPYSDEQYWYEALQPNPVKPGEIKDSLTVFHPTSPSEWAQDLGSGRWRFSYKTTPNSDKEWILVFAVRLPAGARFVSADLEPTEVKQGEAPTIIWRRLLPKITPERPAGWSSNWQFECTLEYEFQQNKSRSETKVRGVCESPCVLRAPEIVFKLWGAPWKRPDVPLDELLEEAGKADLPYMRPWFALGYMLYDAGRYEEAMEAFEQVRHVQGPAFLSLRVDPLYKFTAIVWQGHILDILGRREEALGKYREALETGTGGWLNGTYCNLKIDRQWVEERLERPFRVEMQSEGV